MNIVSLHVHKITYTNKILILQLMKKILLITLMSFIYLNTFAEKEVGNYYTDYFENKKFVIEASEPKDGEFTLYIQVAGDDSEKAFVSIDSDKVVDLITFLTNMKNKYVEWSDVAKNNNISEFNKEMKFKTPRLGVAWLGSKWWFSYGHRIAPTFRIMDDGSHIVSMVRKAKSSSNQYIDETIFWVFGSSEAIDSLISQLDVKRILGLFEKQSNASGLFK